MYIHHINKMAIERKQNTNSYNPFSVKTLEMLSVLKSLVIINPNKENKTKQKNTFSQCFFFDNPGFA